MRAGAITKRAAAPLACTLGLALIAAAATPGLAQTTTPAAQTPAAAQSTAPAKTAAQTSAPAAATAKTQVKSTTATAKSTTATSGATATAATTAKPAATTTVATRSPATAGTPAPATVAARPAASATTAAATPRTTKKSATRTDSTATAAATKKKDAEGDYTLRGGQEGTVFKSLTVEGEDRVHVDFERPELKLDLDLEKAPGLDWGSAVDVLNRTATDLGAPLVGLSAKQTNPYIGRPWLSEFATGPVARFHPAAEGVDHWKLVVVDSKGAAVR